MSKRGKLRQKGRRFLGYRKFWRKVCGHKFEKVSLEASHRLNQFKPDQLLKNANKFLTHSILSSLLLLGFCRLVVNYSIVVRADWPASERKKKLLFSSGNGQERNLNFF